MNVIELIQQSLEDATDESECPLQIVANSIASDEIAKGYDPTLYSCSEMLEILMTRMQDELSKAREQKRLAKQHAPYKRFPLADWKMTEAQCLKYCNAYGHTWEQDGVQLYDVLDRVSCWCCRNKNQKELKAIHDNLPRYWNQLLALESRLGTMKSKPLQEIGGDEFVANGMSKVVNR